ncbi:aminoglycoside adenylyltransferase domain-containing protein [Streptomyces sp. Marseille-Q5077]|uniref:aminoglycoside adenylyltransferase domain-containing protein n=1 Tax=Streptomyces sp. Marseille-Q5077 TaxID=3418995 RepID=UPI003D020B96
MTRTLVDPYSVPDELRPYLQEVVQRTHALCGSDLVSVIAVGSVALGDYRHGRSDVDVTVVVDGTAPGPAVPELAAALAHPALPCPAAGLELVVYDRNFTARPSGEAGYLLDINTGPLLPERASVDASESPAFWYVIDRSVAHQAGRVLYGRPAREVIAEPARADVLTALRASVREHSSGEGHLADNRVLNGCRSVQFCRTGRWQAKRRAAEAVAASEERFRPLLRAALHSYERPSRTAATALPTTDVHTFLAWVAERVDESSDADRRG